MKNISKKLVIAIVVLIAFIVAGGWFRYAKQKGSENTLPDNSIANTAQDTEETKGMTRFVTDVDMDVSHWQTGGTEFLSMKFPKEWYWVEISPEKPGYFGAYVISNNPNFPLAKYSDIGRFTGYDYSSFVLNNDSEVVVTTNNLGAVTSNSGTPREFMDGEIARLKKDLYPEMECQYTSSLTNIPLTAFCSFIDNNNQRVETYYVSMVKRTFAFTSRTTITNNADTKSILEKVAQSLQLKKDF